MQGRGGDQPGEAADDAADQAGDEVRARREQRQRDQHRRGDDDADHVVLLVDRPARLGAADREPGGDRAQRHAVAAGDHGEVVLGVGDAAGGQHPQRAAGEQQHRGRDAAEPALDPGREDRQADRDDEQVADVDVGEGGGEEAPPLVVERDHQAAEGGERVAAGLLDQQQDRRSRG